MSSRWRHPPKTVSPRPYCRSRRGRSLLGSETSCYLDSSLMLKVYLLSLLVRQINIRDQLYICKYRF